MRKAGPTGPKRPGGPLRPEQADRPLHAAGARCCAPGAAWLAPDVQQAGHGTAGPSPAPECAAYRRARGHGWRMAGRGLVTGGFLLCGWLVTGAGHAYAAQVTAPAAPHEVLTGIGTGSSLAGPDAGQAGQLPALQRPASMPLAVPSFPGDAGVGAGNHDTAGPAAAPAPALSRTAAAMAGPAVSGPAVSLASALSGPGAGGQAALGPGLSGMAGSGAQGQAVTGPCVPGLPGSGAQGPVEAIGKVASGLTGSQAQGAVASIGTAVSGLAEPGAGAMPRALVSPPLVMPQAAPGGPPATVTTVRPAAGHPRTRSSAARRSAGAVRLTSASSGLAYPALAGHPLARGHRGGTGSRAARAGTRHRSGFPTDRLTPGAAAQTDPASSGSASSGSGAGAGQLAAQAPPGAGARMPSARLIRIRSSRWPAGFLPADDPAVSPD